MSDSLKTWWDNPKTKLVVFSVGAAIAEVLLLWLNWRALAPTKDAMNAMQAMMLGNIDMSDPHAFNGAKEILVKLLWLNVFTFADLGVNISVLVAASRRRAEDYPEHQKKAAWLAALWFVFFVVQLPTGVPSALVYWTFIVRPKTSAAQSSEPLSA